MKENNFGKLISKLRKEKGLTQKELAKELCISDKAVSRWELGKSTPDLETIFAIGNFFEVPYTDLLSVIVSDNENGSALVEQLIKDVSLKEQKYSKNIKTILTVTLIIILSLIITIIFTHTFNRFKVYRVNFESNDLYSVMGVYVETNIRDVLQLNSIKIKNVEIKETDTVTVDLYFTENDKEFIIQSYSSLDNIYFVNYQSYIEIDDLSDYANNLYVRVTLINDKGKTKEYNGQIKFLLDFSNNKIFYKDDSKYLDNKSINFSPDEIKDILLKNGFEETANKVYFKINKDINISYISSSNKISISYEKGKLSYRYIYLLNSNILEVMVFDENTTEIENYKYDVTNDEVIECKTGSCNDYKKTLKFLNENILNLLYKN